MASEKNTFTSSRSRRNLWYSILSLVLLFLVVILIMSLFFRVRKIEVVNASEYTDAQIIEASGLQTGGSIFFVDRFSAASLIYANLPYMEEVAIQGKGVDTVVIMAKGTASAAWMTVDGATWLVDRKGEMLGTADATETEGLPELRGLNPLMALEGEIMTLDFEEEDKLTTATELLSALVGEDMLSVVDWIDVSDPQNPAFRYDGRLTVYPGELSNAAYRLANFRAALKQLSAEDAGVLTWQEGSSWTYSPE